MPSITWHPREASPRECQGSLAALSLRKSTRMPTNRWHPREKAKKARRESLLSYLLGSTERADGAAGGGTRRAGGAGGGSGGRARAGAAPNPPTMLGINL